MLQYRLYNLFFFLIDLSKPLEIHGFFRVLLDVFALFKGKHGGRVVSCSSSAHALGQSNERKLKVKLEQCG